MNIYLYTHRQIYDRLFLYIGLYLTVDYKYIILYQPIYIYIPIGYISIWSLALNYTIYVHLTI